MRGGDWKAATRGCGTRRISTWPTRRRKEFWHLGRVGGGTGRDARAYMGLFEDEFEDHAASLGKSQLKSPPLVLVPYRLLFVSRGEPARGICAVRPSEG